MFEPSSVFGAVAEYINSGSQIVFIQRLHLAFKPWLIQPQQAGTFRNPVSVFSEINDESAYVYVP